MSLSGGGKKERERKKKFVRKNNIIFWYNLRWLSPWEFSPEKKIIKIDSFIVIFNVPDDFLIVNQWYLSNLFIIICLCNVNII